ncbi:MAG: hypothetical protein ACOCR8_03225, partial [Desulfosalsimonas sp.]
MSEQKDIFAEKELGKTADIGLLRRLYPFVAPYKLFMLAALFLMAAATLLELAVPYVTKEAIDRYIVPEQGGPDIQGLNITGVVLLVIILLNLAVGFV